MQNIENNDNEMTIEQFHEEQDREIYKYYNNSENFFEKIYNECFLYINEIYICKKPNRMFETNHLSSDFLIIIIVLIIFGLFGINNDGLLY